MTATPYIEFIPEAGACLATTTVRYIAPDDSVLFAASAVSPHQTLEVFCSGRRSDTSKFRATDS